MQVYHNVIPLTGRDYARTIEAFVENVSPLQGVLAVFQFGAVSTPGVSDIDALVVVDDRAPESTLRAVVAATRADRVSRYLFAHPPVVVPRSSLGEVGHIHSLYNLRQLWGEPTEIRSPADDVQPYLDIAEYVDFTFAARTVLRSAAGTKAGLRKLLLSLTSCTHSLRLASSITGRALDQGVPDRVMRLREQSLNGGADAIRAAAAVAGDCLDALRKADRCLETHLGDRGIVRPSPLSQCIPHTDGRFYLFETPYVPRSAAGTGSRRPTGMWWKVAGVDPSVESFPGFYLTQFAAYGIGSGIYANVHRAFFGRKAADRILDDAYRALLTRRRQVVQHVYDAVRRGGIIPMVPLGIGFRMPDRIRVSRRRLLLRGLAARRLAGSRRG